MNQFTFYSIHWHFTRWKQTDRTYMNSTVAWNGPNFCPTLPRIVTYIFASHSFSRAISKYFRSFLTLFSFSIAKKDVLGKNYLGYPLRSIIMIIIIFFTSSVSSLHHEHSRNQILRNLKFCCLRCNRNTYTTPRRSNLRERGMATSVIDCFRTLYFITTLWADLLLPCFTVLCEVFIMWD